MQLLLNKKISLPDFYRVKMHYPEKGMLHLKESVLTITAAALADHGVKKNDTIAVCVGSRGINNLPVIVRSVCESIINMGAKPYIIPAMGSHGGADAKGQEAVLASLGVREKACLAPVISSMEVEIIGHVFDEVPVVFSKDILSMDHSICINRIKPHTKFKGDIESGICKMLAVGMGKHQGAINFHDASLRHGMLSVLKSFCDVLVANTNFRFGIAVVEDFHKETMMVKALSASDLFVQEAIMLNLARENFPKLPFKKLDSLIIKKIGKDISGSGMDPNVTGRAYDLMEDDFSDIIDITRIAILDLTEKTQGNAIGLGNADIITEKLYQKLDYKKTLINALTSVSLRKAFIPVRMEDEKAAVLAAFTTTGIKDTKNIRAVFIEDTLQLSEFWVSESLLEEIPEAEIIEKSQLDFNQEGDFVFIAQNASGGSADGQTPCV